MTIKLSMALRNARLDTIETVLGGSPIMKIFTGAAPGAVADADSGTVLATLSLPADALAAASSAQKAMQGDWGDEEADAAGTAGHFRLYEDDGTTCHLQGTITASGGGGDMELDNTVFAEGQAFSITSFVLNEPNG